MKITYRFEKYFKVVPWWGCLPGLFLKPTLWRSTYTIVDPNHNSAQGIVTEFKAGDIIFLPCYAPDSRTSTSMSGFDSVQCAAADSIQDWDIIVRDITHLGGGPDFSLCYLIKLKARKDGARLNSFDIYFKWIGSVEPGSQMWSIGSGMPGSQRWYFSAFGAPPSNRQYWEEGDTVPA